MKDTYTLAIAESIVFGTPESTIERHPGLPEQIAQGETESISWANEPDSWQMKLIREANSKLLAKTDAVDEEIDLNKPNKPNWLP